MERARVAKTSRVTIPCWQFAGHASNLLCPDIFQVDARGGQVPVDRFELDDPVTFTGTSFGARAQ